MLNFYRLLFLVKSDPGVSLWQTHTAASWENVSVPPMRVNHPDPTQAFTRSLKLIYDEGNAILDVLWRRRIWDPELLGPALLLKEGEACAHETGAALKYRESN